MLASKKCYATSEATLSSAPLVASSGVGEGEGWGAGARGKGKPAWGKSQGRPGVEVRVDRGKNNQGRSGVKVQVETSQDKSRQVKTKNPG